MIPIRVTRNGILPIYRDAKCGKCGESVQVKRLLKWLFVWKGRCPKCKDKILLGEAEQIEMLGDMIWQNEQ